MKSCLHGQVLAWGYQWLQTNTNIGVKPIRPDETLIDVVTLIQPVDSETVIRS
jgi:hypothetical protein